MVPVTTPIHTAVSYFYDDVADLDRVFAATIPGPSYSRHGNPTNEALEELVASLECRNRRRRAGLRFRNGRAQPRDLGRAA